MDEVRAAAPGIAEHLGFDPVEPEEPVALEDIRLPSPRLKPPGQGVLCAVDAHARVTHAQGKSYVDVLRGLRGRFDSPPDVVAYPRDEREIEVLLEWAAAQGAVVIPYGGGTSVVGGVTPPSDRPSISLDLRGFSRVIGVDAVSRAARVGAGLTGPALDAALGEHGFTARFYPQSFEMSTVGGWIATRAGGHFATGPTHIDDLVESVRAITPSGEWESRRLPGSGAGPSPDRMLLGSEGILGVITEAWIRVQPRPEHRAGRTVRFGDFMDGAGAVRALAQSNLRPSNCRLIEATEAGVTGAGDGRAHLLILGFESTDHPVDADLARGLELCAEYGGEWDAIVEAGAATGGAGAWRDAFLRAPYTRDTLVQCGVLSETFETAITWDRFPRLFETVTEAAREALGDRRAKVTCRFTHAYADGPAPYFTILAPARRGEEEGQWQAVKRAASDALIAAGGTITHHHAVGRDHRRWYDRQRPDLFAAALRAAKAEVDPHGILNPGVLIDP